MREGRRRVALIACCSALLAWACSKQPRDEEPPPLPECPVLEWAEPPACGSGSYAWSSLIPGPGEVDHDAALALEARRHDRQFHAFNAHGTDVNADVAVPLEMAEERVLIEQFVGETDGWDFEAWSGRAVTEVVESWQKVAGLYAGAGIAADALRYGTLRDQGADCDEIEVARQHVLAGMDALHLATAITGAEGSIARGFMRMDLPGTLPETVPLFDGSGSPLPEEKNNGTWREDNSGGLYPEYIWEDSCSRDMYIGWALAIATVWEVVQLDPRIPQARKDTLQADAAALARGLMIVRESGFDLEIWDPDGRRTYHGILHEEAFDRIYLPPSKNGQHAVMALGIVAGLAFVAGQEDIDAYLWNDLVRERQLHVHARDMLGIVDAGVRSNYSNYNMAFIGVWLAHRYLCDPEVRAVLQDAAGEGLYDRPGRERQPADVAQTFFDLVYVATRAGATVWAPMGDDVDAAAVGRGMGTLRAFAPAPYWEEGRMNCDEDEIAALSCTFIDGTVIELLGYEGRNDALVAAEPVPISIRPHSNYHWRSNPYSVNSDADGTRLLPAVDFRLAYWMGRWVRM